MTLFVSDPDFTLYVGDALEVLANMPDESVHCVVTSPPYWGLRDYGTGEWEGGDPDCDHLKGRPAGEPKDKTSTLESRASNQNHEREGFGLHCGKCGARRVDRQLGLEPSPDEYIAAMVDVFREVRRVLRADGTCFLNIGDSFYSNPAKGGSGPGGKNESRWSYGRGVRGAALRDDASDDTVGTAPRGSTGPDSSCLDLCGECADALLSRSPRSSPPRRGSASPVAPTDPDTSRSDSEPETQPLDAPASTTPGSSPPPPAACWRCGIRPASVALSVAPTSAPDALASARRSACTTGTSATQPSSADRSPDTESSALAYLYSSIAARRLRPKDAALIPQILALALQMDGWIVRSEIIWAKKNCMPESVTDRPTKSHEQIWLLTKGPRYFFDQEAVREKWADGRMGLSYPNGAPEQQATKGNPNRNDGGHTSSARGPDARRATRVVGAGGSLQHRDGERWPNGGRNVRSVWEIATQPYPEAHFATFPEALPERCIKAGTSERGCCPECGAPWERIVERTAMEVRSSARLADRREVDAVNDARTATSGTMTKPPTSVTTGWRPTCGCTAGEWAGVVLEPEPVPCAVLDPFMGSGTTALVARRLGRKSIGIELNQSYAELAARRLQQLSLLAEGDAA